MKTIKDIINNNNETESNIEGSKLIIKNINDFNFFNMPMQVFFGELLDIPEQFFDFPVIRCEKIFSSCIKERIGANVLYIAM